MNNAKLTFWGTRGSTVQTNPKCAKFGLDTACITLELEEEIIIFDSGSGIRSFDEYFYANNLQHKKIKMFITHYHHDHICGLPFANFIYDNEVVVEIYSGNVNEKTGEEVLNTVFEKPYFPIPIMQSENISFFEVKKDAIFDFGYFQVHTIPLNHGEFCTGYKVIVDNKEISLITDYEYSTDENSDKVEAFMSHSDIIIMDSFYRLEDYRENWGHSTIEECVYLMNRHNVKQGFLFHHNTIYTDDILSKFEEDIQTYNPHICFAKDGMVIDI